MGYSRGKFKLERLYASAKLGFTAVLGEMRLGMSTDLRQAVDVSSFSVADGYGIESNGALTLDPATATAAMAVRGDVALNLGNNAAVEASYDGVIVFAGLVTGLKLIQVADPSVPSGYVQRVTYTLASIELRLMQAIVTWTALPAEPAITRLGRWFDVDTSAVSAGHLSFLETEMPAVVEAGSATKLDIAREFSAVTLLPVRQRSYLVGAPSSLAVLDPTTEPAAIGDAADWVHSVDFEQRSGGLVPTAVDVITNDMRLAGGLRVVDVDATFLGSTFVLGVSRLGSSGALAAGFLAPSPVDIFGHVLPVARVSQTFAREYSAEIELSTGSGGGSIAISAGSSGGGLVNPVPATGVPISAIGDGITDAGAAINAAIAASPEHSAIVFPGGVYIIETPILLKANRSYIAMGDVILRQKPNTELECMVKVEPTEDIPRRNIHWMGIKLDGNAMNPHFNGNAAESPSNVLQTNNTVYRAGSGFDANHGMVLEGVQFSNFIDLHILHCGGDGLVLRGLPADPDSGEWDYNRTTSTVHFVSPYVYACGRYGVYFAERSDDNHISFGDIGATQYEGAYFIAGSNSLRSCTVWGSKLANGILLGGPTNQIIACQVEGHAQHGIKIVDYGSYNYIADCKIYYCSTQTPGSYDGINLNGSSTHLAERNTIVGNFIYAGIGDFFLDALGDVDPSLWVGMRHGVALETYTARTFIDGNNVDLVPPGAEPNTAYIGVYGIKAGDTYNGVRWTDATEDADRLAATPDSLIPGQLWHRDDVGHLYNYTGPTRARIERVAMRMYDIEAGTVSASGTSVNVPIPNVRFDANYAVAASPSWATSWWVTDKFTDQFTIHFGTAPGGASPCDWTLTRHT